MKTLGILITSDLFLEYVVPLVRAAKAKGLMVHIHLTGSGVRLTQSTDYENLTQMARITICHDSAVSYQIRDKLKAGPGELLARQDQMTRMIKQCYRHVVL